jgi:large conductance mechanosensitive channel
MKNGFRTMWSEFKAFAFKGNMIELAVAVVIGAAFGRVITSLVEDVIMPTVQYSIHAAREGAKVVEETTKKAAASLSLATSQPATTPSASQPVAAPAPPAPIAAPAPPPAPIEAKKDDKVIEIDWKIGPVNIGKFIGALINFLIVAFAVFITMVKVLGSVMKKVGGTPAPSEPTTKECPKCLSVIPLRATKCPQCTADIGVPIVSSPLAE